MNGKTFLKRMFAAACFAAALTLCRGAYAQQELRAQPGTVPAPYMAQPFEMQFFIPLPNTSLNDVVLDAGSIPEEDFEITETSFESNNNGILYKITLVPFVLGEVKLNLSWTVKTAKNDSLKATGGEITFDVKPVATHYKNFVEIRQPFMPYDWLLWLAVLACAALAGVLFFYRDKIFKIQKKDFFSLEKSSDPRTPGQRAREEISQLERSPLWRQQEYKLYYFKLTDIFREYMQDTTLISANFQTTYEFLRELKKTSYSNLLPKSKDFLNSADLVKFARQTPSEEQKKKDLSSVLEIINTITPEADGALPTRAGRKPPPAPLKPAPPVLPESVLKFELKTKEGKNFSKEQEMNKKDMPQEPAVLPELAVKIPDGAEEKQKPASPPPAKPAAAQKQAPAGQPAEEEPVIVALPAEAVPDITLLETPQLPDYEDPEFPGAYASGPSVGEIRDAAVPAEPEEIVPIADPKDLKNEFPSMPAPEKPLAEHVEETKEGAQLFTSYTVRFSAPKNRSRTEAEMLKKVMPPMPGYVPEQEPDNFEEILPFSEGKNGAKEEKSTKKEENKDKKEGKNK